MSAHHVRFRALPVTAAFVAAMAFLAPALSAQQSGTVIARVTNGTTKQPLSDVQVSVVGTTLGALSNQEGRALILQVPAGEQVISAQLIGYGAERETVTVTAGGTTEVEIELNTRAVQLEGVVVTGTAIAAQRREIGNTISLITADEIATAGAMNFEDLLRGRALGVSISGTPGQAGAGSEILLRGVNSVNGRNRPLIYIDGIRMSTENPEDGSGGEVGELASFLGSINPDDVERMEIIKGAAASTLYGTEASAGVIQIFTKKGQAGAPRWTASVEQGFSFPGLIGTDEGRKIDPTGLNLNDCTRMIRYDTANMAFAFDDLTQLEDFDQMCPARGSWLRDAFNQDYSLQVRGGAEDLTYFFSGSWSRDDGLVAPQNAKSINFRANFSFNGFEDLQIRLNNFFSRRDIKWIASGRDSEGIFRNAVERFDGAVDDNLDMLALGLDLNQFINHFNTSTNITWTPLDNFRHRFNAGLDYTNSDYRTERPWNFWSNPEGDRAVDIENRLVVTADYAGSWFQQLPNAFTSTFSFGGQYNLNEHLGLRGDSDVFLGPGDVELEDGAEHFNQEDRTVNESGGFFLQEQIGWNNRLFITAGFRADTHSSFGSDYTLDQTFTIFPKVQATYTLSDHAGWPSWFETFRVRGAYGESGDPPPASASAFFWDIAGADDDELGFIIGNQGNPDAGPERTDELELGFDASILNQRVQFTGTWYKQNTTDGLIFITPPGSNGIAERIPANVGNWTSKGYEAAIDVLAFQSGGTRVSVNTRYQYNRTEMRETGSREFGDDGFNFNFLQDFRVGFPLPSLFGTEIVNLDSIGQLPNFCGENDVDAGLCEVAGRNEFIGPTRPPHEASLGVNATFFDRLTLDVFAVGAFGHVLYDNALQELAADRILPECWPIDVRVSQGDFADIPTRDILRCATSPTNFANNNEGYFDDADYVRLQSTTLSYRIPESVLPSYLDAATLQFQAQNLFTITGFNGLYPDSLNEVNTQTARQGGYLIPPPRTYTLNVRVNF